MSGIYLPNRCEFYDLDSDGIPEAVIVYVPYIAHGGLPGDVYKLYETSYEFIGTIDRGECPDHLYITPQKKVISIKLHSTDFLEIKNKEIVYSEYIDSKGNRGYDAIKYGETGNLLDEGFKVLPKIDCSRIIAEITPNFNPQTGDTPRAVLLAAAVVSLALPRIFRRRRI